MSAIWTRVLQVLRSSEFYVLLAQWVITAMALPIPEEFKAAGWVYIAARVLGKIVQFIWPNPTSASPGFLKDDSTS